MEEKKLASPIASRKHSFDLLKAFGKARKAISHRKPEGIFPRKQVGKFLDVTNFSKLTEAKNKEILNEKVE